MDNLLLWLLLDRDGVSVQLGLFTASWLAAVISFSILPVNQWRPKGEEWESGEGEVDRWALRSVKWFTVLGCILSGIPIVAGCSSMGRPTSRWDIYDESWNLTYTFYGFLVGILFPVIAWLGIAGNVQAANKALCVFLSVGLYPWRAIVRFFRKFGSRVAAGVGIWVALGCLNFFWPALTVILFAIAAYYILTTTRFVEFWLLLAGWFAFAQLCDILAGIWSLFYPPRTPGAGRGN